MQVNRVGFFSGSFDPMTNGHLDVIEHAAALCDRLVIGVGSNPSKAALFTVEERLKLIREAAAPIMKKARCELDVVEFTGLAVAAARVSRATEAVSLAAVTSAAGVLEMRESLERVEISPDLLDYVVAIVGATRRDPQIQVGASPRGGLALVQLARGQALLH